MPSTAGNYGITTTPGTEWLFVASPDSQEKWPLEAKLAEAPEKQRKPLPLAELHTSLEAQNQRLKSLGEPPLIEIEAFGGRLYTCAHAPCDPHLCMLLLTLVRIVCSGPMFVKYNRNAASATRTGCHRATCIFSRGPCLAHPPPTRLHVMPSACSVAFRSTRRGGGRASTWAA